MKTATLPRAGCEYFAVRWLGLLAIAMLLPGAGSLQAQSSQTATTVTTLGGGPQYYNSGSSFGSSNSVYGTLYSQFHTPAGIAVDNELGVLYVADRDNNAVRYLDLVSGQTYTLAPYPPYIPTNVISKPVGVAVDALGNVYVLNRGNGSNGTVVEIDYYGNYITNMTHLTNASGIALDAVGNIYLTASNTVIKVTPAGVSNIVVTIPNAGTSLQGIVVKRSGVNVGKLAVCDSGTNGNGIWLIDPTATNSYTKLAGFNGAGDGTGLNNRGVANALAQFFQPSGLAEAGDGSLIVADYGNQRVKVVAATGYTTNLYGVASNLWYNNGSTAYSGWSDGTVWQPDTLGDVQARMPFGVAIGADGTVYTTEDYYHIIRTVTAANVPVPPPWPPAPPSTLGATAGYGQVALIWPGSSTATNYNVKRSTTSGSETTIATTTGTSYTDTNLLDGTTYYYVVSGSNTGGEGENSPETSVTPMFSPTPTNLFVTATNFGLISLSWSPSAGAISYNIKRSTSSGHEATIASVTGTTFSDTSVSNGTAYYYVVSAVNPGGESSNSTEIGATAPAPPPPSPSIGWFDYEGINPPVSVFHAVSSLPFTTYNDLSLAIVPNASGVNTYYYYTTDGSIPSPTNGTSGNPPPYQNSSPNAQTPLSVTATPDLRIMAMNVGPGGDSDAAYAQFIFQTADPNIIGNNASQFKVNDVTDGAQFLYTADGSDPRTNLNATPLGPITGTNGITLSLPFPANTNAMLFQIVAFKANYMTSHVASVVFSTSNYVANTISFGFASGEASSDFVAAPGQTFYAPITLTTLPSTTMYSLQFNLSVNPGGTNPGPAWVVPQDPSTPFGFTSMLMKPIPGVTPVVYEPIPPAMFAGYQSVPNPVYLDGSTNFSSLLFTNNSINLMGVGWVERAGATNLYDTTKQTLLTYSMAHDDMFPNPSAPQNVVIGGYAFSVPKMATIGQTYQIKIGLPSATSDGIGTPGSSVFISAPTNGSLGGGSINAVKNVTVGSRKYLVGNVYPFRWFNAGDFGNTNLQNADVEQVFEAAVYNLNSPAFQAPGSDFFDAMDSCGLFGALDTDPADPLYNVYTNSNADLSQTQRDALFEGNDTTINQVMFGDSVLDVCDVYVTFRRSLDTNNLVWVQRFWKEGQRVAVVSNAPAIQSAAKSPGKVLPAFNIAQGALSVTNTPAVNFTAGDLQAAAGQTIQIPVSASVFGPYPLRVALLNISVVPLDGSPALTTPISFTPGVALGKPAMTESTGPGNYAAAWLNSAITGISNNGTIGTLNVTIPSNANAASAYAVHFDRASGSPNGLGSFPLHAYTGLITLASRTNSSYNDGIPDAWRLRWFGTIYNQLSVSNACPSGDGVSNWQKYLAGVDPNTPNDFPSLNPNTPPAGSAMSVYWPTVSGKHYAVLSSASLFPGNWTTNTIVTGTGANMQFNDNATGPAKFYRVLILP